MLITRKSKGANILKIFLENCQVQLKVQSNILQLILDRCTKLRVFEQTLVSVTRSEKTSKIKIGVNWLWEKLSKRKRK